MAKQIIDNIMLLAGLLLALSAIVGAVAYVAARWKSTFKDEVHKELEEALANWKTVAESLERVSLSKDEKIEALEKEQIEQNKRIEANTRQLREVQGENAQLREMYIGSQKLNNDLMQANEALRVDNHRLYQENQNLLKSNTEISYRLHEVESMLTFVKSQLQECLKTAPLPAT